jgi:hypothetical protein
MIKKYFILMLSLIVGSIAFAKEIKIIKPTERRPSQSGGEDTLANSSFIGFLKCSASKTEPETLKCIRRYFTAETSDAMILRYSEALLVASEYTELYHCDDKKKKTIEVFEEKTYDFFLCFQSNMVSDSDKPGVAYFKKSSGMPKLMRLQM